MGLLSKRCASLRRTHSGVQRRWHRMRCWSWSSCAGGSRLKRVGEFGILPRFQDPRPAQSAADSGIAPKLAETETCSKRWPKDPGRSPVGAWESVARFLKEIEMIKLVYCIRKLETISSEEFYRYWLEDHGPLVKSVAADIGARRYVQSHTVLPEINAMMVEGRGLAEPYDGITEVWWDNRNFLADETVGFRLSAPFLHVKGGTRLTFGKPYCSVDPLARPVVPSQATAEVRLTIRIVKRHAHHCLRRARRHPP